MKYPAPPAHNAGEEAWLKWVDDVCPLGCRDYQGPPELHQLTRVALRDIAAQSARSFFAIHAKQRQPRTPAPHAASQCGLFGDNDK
jgi:hypothetical protein